MSHARSKKVVRGDTLAQQTSKEIAGMNRKLMAVAVAGAFVAPALVYALRGLGKPGGAITAAVVAMGVLGSLVLLRQDLVGRPRTIPRA